MTNAITFSGVSKRYVKYEDTPMLLTWALRLRSGTRRSDLWALRDVSFAAAPGEAIGVIGRNGSGKSTMLRLLAGVTAPTEGRVTVVGRVAPLISVGVGFHPELTGRENVHVNGTILGLSRSEIDRKFDEIVDFAEIGPFLETPVKFYSSGMFVRLGFSVAVLARPDVLLVDEVLAVGDVAFQMKCYDRMLEIMKGGTTLVVVSHNLNMVRNMCARTLLVHDGQLRHDGDTAEAISLYHDVLRETREPDSGHWVGHSDDAGSLAAEIERFEMVGPDGRPTAHVSSGDLATFEMDVRFLENTVRPVFGMNVSTDAGVKVYGDSSPWEGTGSFVAGERVRFQAIVEAQLATGTYTVQAGLRSSDSEQLLTRLPRPLMFFVSGRSQVAGISDLRGRFEIERIPLSSPDERLSG